MKRIFYFKFFSLLCIFFLIKINSKDNLFGQSIPSITISAGMPSISTKEIAYGNGIYLAVTDKSLYKSTDGMHWQLAASATGSTTFNGIVFGTNKFVIIGTNGFIATTNNGTTITSITSPTTQNLNDVIFANGKYYAIGEQRTVISSSDGTNWSTMAISVGNSTDMLLTITYGANKLVVSGRSSSGSGALFYSCNIVTGSSWNFVSISSSALSVNRVQYLNNKFYAFFVGGNIYTSTDASTWTDITNSINELRPNGTTVAYGNNNNQIYNGIEHNGTLYFFGSSSYFSGYTGVWKTTNGTTLTLDSTNVVLTPSYSPGKYINDTFFMTGGEGIVISTDGTHYQYITGNFNSVATNGTTYIGVGTNGSQSGVIFTSTNFTDWTNITPNNIGELYGVDYVNSQFIAVGKNKILGSTNNGQSWTVLASTTNLLQDITHNNSGQLVAVGDQIIKYSNNGSTWTNASTVANYYYKVQYLNGDYFALGFNTNTYNGVIMSSSDGINWADITPNLSYNVTLFSDITYNNGIYTIVGTDNNYNLFITNTSNPSNAASYGTAIVPSSSVSLTDWGGNVMIAYNNGHYIATAVDQNIISSSYLLFSNDGLTWSDSAIQYAGYINSGLITGNNTFKLLGANDVHVTLNYSTILPITYLSFTAKAQANSVKLIWETTKEINNKGFAIQRSNNSKSWENLAFVAAQSSDELDSTLTYDYTYFDNKPMNGINYYRLQQIDLDGNIHYSIIQSAIFNNTNISIYPNPTENNLYLNGLQYGDQIIIQDIVGNIVLNQNYSNINNVDVKNFTSGTYLLQIFRDGNLLYNNKVIVTH